MVATRSTPFVDKTNSVQFRTPGKSPSARASRTPGKSPYGLGVKSPGVHKKAASTPAGGIKASPYKPPRTNSSRAKLHRSSCNVSAQHVSYELLNGTFNVAVYQRYSNRALADRKRRGAGQSQEMNTLYRFWSYFLRKKHDMKMYSDFKHYAAEDARRSYMYGLQTLFRYYSYGLEANFDARRWRDFQDEVLKEVEQGSLYGLEKLMAFLKFRGPDAPWAPVMPEVRKLIQTHSNAAGEFVGPKAAAVGDYEVGLAPAAASASGRRALSPVNGNVVAAAAANGKTPAKTPAKTPTRQSARHTLNPFASCFVPTAQTDSPEAMSMTPTPFRATRARASAIKSLDDGDWNMQL